MTDPRVPTLRVERLQKSYGSKIVLRDVDLEVMPVGQHQPDLGDLGTARQHVAAHREQRLLQRQAVRVHERAGQRLERAGVSGYITKPVHVTELFEAIVEAVKVRA